MTSIPTPTAAAAAAAAACNLTVPAAIGGSAPVGVGFGFLLEKSSVYRPEVIKGQMSFDTNTMLKVFLSASGTSALVFSALKLLGKARFERRNLSYFGNIVGGSVLGSGMALGGTCPGTMIVQLGAGRQEALYNIAGGLVGALGFGYSSKFILPLVERTSRGAVTIDSWLRMPYARVASVFGISMIGAAALIEAIQPSSTDAATNSISFNNPIWNPVLCGVGIGLMQLPLQLATGNTLGTSAAYVTVSGTIARLVHRNLPAYFSKFSITKPAGLWQLALNSGLAIGAYAAASSSGTRQQNIEDARSQPLTTQQKMTSLFSGFLLVYGARIAGGCTSGHGLSGMATLSTGSMLSVASMFGSGIALTFLMRQFERTKVNGTELH